MSTDHNVLEIRSKLGLLKTRVDHLSISDATKLTGSEQDLLIADLESTLRWLEQVRERLNRSV